MGMKGNLPAAQRTPPVGWQPVPYPRGLNGAEMEYWNEFMAAPSAQMLDGNDVPVLRALCEAMVTHDKIRNAMKEAPLVVTGFGGSIKTHPLLDEAFRLRSQIKQLASSLGFSPTSRRGAQAPQKVAQIDPDQAFLDSL